MELQIISWRGKWQPTSIFLPGDRGAWKATVHGVARVRHDVATKLPPQIIFFLIIYFRINISIIMYMCVFICIFRKIRLFYKQKQTKQI